jgi:uncharacterized protein YciI
MNRQIRRAQEKSEKKREKDIEKQREARKAARLSRRGKKPAKPSRPANSEQRAKAEAKQADEAPAQVAAPSPARPRRSGRFAGFMALATLVLIIMGAFSPREGEPLELVVDSFFFVFLGYFTALWLLRRASSQVLAIVMSGGLAVAIAVELLKTQGEGLSPQPLLIFTAVPALILGVVLARLVFRRTS